MVSLDVWIQCASVTDRRTEAHRPTDSSALMQRLKINDDGKKKYFQKSFLKKYFQNTILFYISKILFLSIFILYVILFFENAFRKYFAHH